MRHRWRQACTQMGRSCRSRSTKAKRIVVRLSRLPCVLAVTLEHLLRWSAVKARHAESIVAGEVRSGGSLELRLGKAHVLLARHSQHHCLGVAFRIHRVSWPLLLHLRGRLRLHLLLLHELLLLHHLLLLLLLEHHLLALRLHLLLLGFLVDGGDERVDALQLADVEVVE